MHKFRMGQRAYPCGMKGKTGTRNTTQPGSGLKSGEKTKTRKYGITKKRLFYSSRAFNGEATDSYQLTTRPLSNETEDWPYLKIWSLY